MAGVLNYQSNVVLLRKFNTGRYVGTGRGIDAVKWRIAQLASWVGRYRGVNGWTGFDQGIAVSDG